jgi:hypothetical protein
MTEFELGGISAKPAGEAIKRMSVLLWGDAGCGKTIFASTAPGQKLLINFDPDGPASISMRDDVTVLDFSGEPETVVTKFAKNDPIGLDKFLEEHPEFDTVIFDSTTTFSELALKEAVKKYPKSDLLNPGLQGYGARNGIVLETVRSLLRVTGKHNRHCIIIAHEASPTTNDQGVVLFITMNLGGQLPSNIGIKLSEIWRMSEANKVRKISVRPCRGYKPMKSRMFRADGEPEFLFKYDPEKPDSENDHTLANWYEQWKQGSGKKLELPK